MELDVNSITLDEEVEDAFKDSPERRLAAAVLNRAITDLLCDSDQKSQEDAREWILQPITDTPAEFSFQFLCMALDFEPEEVQAAILDLESGVRAA